MPKQSNLTPEQLAAKKAEAAATKAANFKKLANQRVNAALDKIGVIGNLASPNYSYTEEQVGFMKNVILAQVEKTFAHFNKATVTATGFSLDAMPQEPEAPKA